MIVEKPRAEPWNTPKLRMSEFSDRMKVAGR